MPKIMQTGYEDAVRSKLGLKKTELPDVDIQQRLIVDLAESTVIKRVPQYSNITDESDKLYLENAVLSQICYLLCPGMSRRVNLEVQTIDVKWKKDKVDWAEAADSFLEEYENSLRQISTVTVDVPVNSNILGIIKGPSAAGGTA